MVETKLMRDSHKLELTGGGQTALHSHAGDGSLPSGLIVMWSGLLANIPSGWVLCDGQNGAPDLRDKFVVCVDTAEEPGGTGGSETLTHSGCAVQAHSGGSGRSGSGSVAFQNSGDLSHDVTQPNDHMNVRPPFYRLAFIMKT